MSQDELWNLTYGEVLERINSIRNQIRRIDH